MRTTACCGLLISCLISVPVMAQSRFDGTWKIDLAESQPSTELDVYLLQNDTYRCTSCDPQMDIKADGRDQKITGEPCYDTVNLKEVDDRTTEETDKRNGKTVGTSRMTVSSDGKTATVEWTESCNANGDVIAGKDIMSRVAGGPKGSHAISGSWRVTKRVNRSDNALIVTLKLKDGTFYFADPSGQSYAAKLDGTETPIKGDLSNTMVAVRLVDENTIEEADRRDGKTVEIVHFVVSADGKRISVSMENTANGTVRQFSLHKQ